MKTILIDNQKGGCGKTTLTMNLWAALGEASCLLVDTDPQESLMKWASNNEAIIIKSQTKKDNELLSQIKKQNNYEYMLIDGRANISTLGVDYLKLADLVLIPVLPGWLDYDSTADYCDIVKEIQKVNTKLKAMIVINGVVKNSIIAREAESLAVEFEIPILETKVHRRIVFSTCAREGLTVFNTGNTEAQSDIIKLKEEILQCLNR